MARLDVPPGEGGDAVQIWSLQPALGTAAMRLVDAAYNKSILPVRVREAARMRIAQLNECTVCLTFRADTVKEQGLGEDFYCVVGTAQQEDLSEQERLAVGKSTTDRTHLNPYGQKVFGRIVADQLVRTLVELGPDVVGEPAKPAAAN